MLNNIFSSFYFFFHIFLKVINSQTCNPTQVTTSDNCCVGDLSISTTITSIAANAYYNSGTGDGCGTITSLTVSSTVTTIGLKMLLL